MRLSHTVTALVCAPFVHGVDVWCGKAYKQEDSSFNPGGWLNPPPLSDVPLLNFHSHPRMNIYLADEDKASIIVDAEITHDIGVPYCEVRKADYSRATGPEIWQLEIEVDDIEGSLKALEYIKPNVTSVEVFVTIRDLTPRLAPYDATVTLKSADCLGIYASHFQIYRLPLPQNDGSVVRLDYLYGGLQYREQRAWRKIFPFGFYADWGGYLQNSQNQDEYASLKYSIVSPVPGGGDEPFDPRAFASFVEKLDGNGLPSVMYNMRWTYQNDALVIAQVEELKKHRSILLWYTADEPEGQGDPLDAPLQAYDLIKQLDPYHPVSLVLNCANFHYAEYTRGADIILTDPYPIAVNTSWSSRWNTQCNTTYGCCGCDNCKGNFRDVSERLDTLQNFQRWLSNAPLGRGPFSPGRNAGGPKAFWGVPQVFGGSEYWSRPPSAEEEAVMLWLFINHGAKGIIGWLFPTTQELTSFMSAMADVITNEEVTAMLLGDNPRKLDVEVENSVDVDAAAWIVGKAMMVSIIHLGLEDTNTAVTVKLPQNVKDGTVQQLWPPAKRSLFFKNERLGEMVLGIDDQSLSSREVRSRSAWRINGSEATRLGLSAMSVSIIMVGLEE